MRQKKSFSFMVIRNTVYIPFTLYLGYILYLFFLVMFLCIPKYVKSNIQMLFFFFSYERVRVCNGMRACSAFGLWWMRLSLCNFVIIVFVALRFLFWLNFLWHSGISPTENESFSKQFFINVDGRPMKIKNHTSIAIDTFVYVEWRQISPHGRSHTHSYYATDKQKKNENWKCFSTVRNSLE